MKDKIVEENSNNDDDSLVESLVEIGLKHMQIQQEG